ncbi:hypothetical protein PHMEG_00030005 [Phytophthora megakarya]|uniref:Uncharacterized protein n=1 Tax=Phytophthora megakarya TaxID=4795 RepID=A0A225V156_9STRA|nr:hypothetical protein PHMEG_00030005 [Phytophthora megakarya]
MRSRLFHLYRIYNVKMPLTVDNDIQEKVVFAHSFLVISRNLMCHTGNAASV